MYLKWIGAALIALCAIFVSRGYSTFANRRLEQYRGFIAFLAHVEGKITDSLAYGYRLWSGFRCDEPNLCRFITILQDGVSPKEGFETIRSGLCLPDGAVEIVREVFSSFGLEYSERETKRIRSSREALISMLDEEIIEFEKSKKTFTALLFGVSASVIIMLI